MMRSLLVVTLLLFGTQIAHGARCDLLNQVDCGNSAGCIWDTITNPSVPVCACGTQTPVDVVFVVDDSGSVNNAHWQNFENVQNWMSGVVGTAIGPQSRVGIVQFSNTAIVVHSLTASQETSYVQSVISTMNYRGDWTWTKDGVNKGLDEFQAVNPVDPGRKRVLLLVTDGNPNTGICTNTCSRRKHTWCCERDQSQLPCVTSVINRIQSLAVKVLILAVGNFNVDSVGCLTEDVNTDVSTVVDFSATNLANQRTFTDAFLCPKSVSMEITEVRPLPGVAAMAQYVFVEVLNTGDALDLSSNFLMVEGSLMTSTQLDNTKIVTSSSGNILQKNMYLVVFVGLDTPSCYKCQCLVNPNVDGQCSNAIYARITAGSGPITMSSWSVTVKDIDGTVYDSVTFDANKLWTVIPNKYAFYKTPHGSDGTDGANWKKTCYEKGTPGGVEGASCNTGCQVSKCDALGDNGASCSVPGAEVDCGCSANFYTDPLSYVCTPYPTIPPPTACTVDNNFASWSRALNGFDHDYELFKVGDLYPSHTSSGGGSSMVIVPCTDLIPCTWEIRTHQVFKGTDLYSSKVSCSGITSSPTPLPTPKPTSAFPLMGGCACFVRQGVNNILDCNFNYPSDARITTIGFWKGDVYDPNSPAYGANSFSFINQVVNLSWVIQAGVITTTTTKTSPEVLNGRVNCPLASLLPTPSPTNRPTSTPTLQPTLEPSVQPTLSPLNTAPVLGPCGCTVTPGTTNVKVAYSYTDNGAPYQMILWQGSVGNGEVVKTTNSLLSTTTEYNLQLNVASNKGCVLEVKWDLRTGDGFSQSTQKTCTFTTAAPTLQPTQDPSATPTTATPTVKPSSTPSLTPTAKPTYSARLDTCTVDVTRHDVKAIVDYVDPKLLPNNPLTNQQCCTLYLKTSIKEYVLQSGVHPVQIDLTGESGTSLFQVRMTDNSGVDLQTISCSVTTQTPTLAPSKNPTVQPTSAPTYQPPGVHVVHPAIATLCGAAFCPGAASTCLRCACTGALTHICSDPNNPNIQYNALTPVSMGVNENNDVDQIFELVRLPAEYPNRITVDFAFSGSVTGEPAAAFPAKPNDVTVTNPQSGSDSGTIEFLPNPHTGTSSSQSVTVRFPANKDVPVGIETMYMQLSNCQEHLPDGSSVSCDIGYPGLLKISISEPTGSTGGFRTETTAKMPIWVWPAIAAGVLLLAGLGFMAYRKWVANKATKEQANQIDEEIDQIDFEGDPTHLDATVIGTNPLATGVAGHEYGTLGDALEAEREKARRNVEMATVDVDKMTFREQFAQSRPAAPSNASYQAM